MTTMVDPEIQEETTTDKPEIFHYVKKDKILESVVMGEMVQAICGAWFVVTKSPPPNAAVCPDCKDIYDNVLHD